VLCIELIFAVAFVIWLCVYGKNKLVKWFPCIENPSKTMHTDTTNIGHVHSGLAALIIFCNVLVLLLVVLPIGWHNLKKENESCEKLERVVKDLLRAEDVEFAIIEEMVAKIELEIEFFSQLLFLQIL
jgi:hypothetical protein